MAHLWSDWSIVYMRHSRMQTVRVSDCQQLKISQVEMLFDDLNYELQKMTDKRSPNIRNGIFRLLQSVQSDHEHHGLKSRLCASVTRWTSGIISPQPTIYCTFTVHLCWHNILEFVHVAWDFWWLLKGCCRCRSVPGSSWCDATCRRRKWIWPLRRAGHRLTGILEAYTHHTWKARDDGPNYYTQTHTQKNSFILHNSFGSCQVTSYKVRWNPLWTI